MTDAKLNVFLCHSSVDKAAATQLYQRLLDAGAAPWFDKEDLYGGVEWDLAIKKAVRNSDAVVVCLSQASVDRDGYANREIRLATQFAADKTEGAIFLIPVKLDACEMPERLSEWHCIDLFDEDGYEKLLKALQKRAQQARKQPLTDDCDLTDNVGPYAGLKLDGNKFEGSHRKENFSRVSLLGCKYDGCDLSGADFSHSDLRGASFKGALLQGVNFNHAKMGLPPRLAKWLGLLALFLSLIGVMVTLIAASTNAAIVYRFGNLGLISSLITLIAAVVVSLRKGIEDGLKSTFLFMAIIVPAVLIFAVASPSRMTPGAVTAIGSAIIALFVNLLMIINTATNVLIQLLTRVIFGKAGPALFVIVVAGILLQMFGTVFTYSHFGNTAAAYMPDEARRFKITETSLTQLREAGLPAEALEKLRKVTGQSYSSEEEFTGALRREFGDELMLRYGPRILFYSQEPKYGPRDIGYVPFFIAFLVAAAVLALSAFLAREVIKEGAKPSVLLSWAVHLIGRRGTSFENADLKEAQFVGVNFRNTSFSGAKNVESCYWGKEKKDRQFAHELIA